MESVSGFMPLRGLTNSATHHTQNEREDKLTFLATDPLTSDESEFHSTTSSNDGIYDAQRVTSDEEPTADTRIQPEIRPTFGDTPSDRTGLRQTKQVRSDGDRDTGRSPSVHGLCSGNPRHGHCQSWSMDDLHTASQTSGLSSKVAQMPSPSSDEALEAAAGTDVYPHLPPQPQLCRRSTPEGIPSFSTREAQGLRLVPPSRLHRFGKFFQIRLQSSQELQGSGANINGVSNAVQANDSVTTHRQTGGPAEMLRRISGMIRPVSVTPGPSKPRSVALPRGLRMASSPGDLAVADDGSHVRGRFGHRVSGHGVGQRTIDLHPLARQQQASAIEETVRAIDKACTQSTPREQGESMSLLSENWPEVIFGHNHLENQARRGIDRTEPLAATQVSHHDQLVHYVFEAPRRNSTQLSTSVRRSPALHAEPSLEPLTINRVCRPYVHGSSSAIYQSATAANGVCSIRLSDGNNTHSARMIEPAAYDHSGFGPGFIARNTIRDVSSGPVMNDQGQENGSRELRQREYRGINFDDC